MKTTLTPEQRSMRARIAAHARWARNNTTEGTKPKRDSFLARFDREADPDGVLPEAERRRRADSLLREHMTRLAFRSSKARRAAS